MQHPRVIDHCGEIFGKYRSLRGGRAFHSHSHSRDTAMHEHYSERFDEDVP